jgi:endonuclease-3 related protein
MNRTKDDPGSVAALREAYERMRAAHGHQKWWPAETPFEVCVGAILTQNTAWTNVERALARLQEAGVLEPLALYELPESALADLLRPAGTFRVKARRLRAFLRVLIEECHGDLARLFAGGTHAVRARLLEIPGIGPETADCLLLYAGGHLSFVIDAYTKRILVRHGWCHPKAGYDDLQAGCAEAASHVAGADPLDAWQDFHAQLVRVGKDFCRARAPRCEQCPLQPLLPEAGPVENGQSRPASRSGSKGSRDRREAPFR